MAKKILDTFRSNLVLKIFSLVLALLLWLYIQIVQNPEVSYEIFEIPVTVSGEADINSEGFVMSTSKNLRVNVTVSAKRSMIHMLDISDFSAVIDVSNLKNEGEFDLPIKVRAIDSEITIVGKSPSEIPVNIDRITTVEKPVKISFDGYLDPNYYIDKENVECVPSKASIKVPELMRDTIDCFSVPIDMTGMKTTVTAEFPGVLIDQNGDIVSDKNISSSIDKITVTIPVYRRKTVPIKMRNIPADISNYTLSSDTVEIAGSEEVVSKINSVDGYLKDYETGETEYSYKVTLKSDGFILIDEGKEILFYPSDKKE